MWREVPFLWTNWPGPSQMMRGGRNRWPLIAERVRRKDPFFSQAAVTVGYANGLLTDWRQNCHFPGQYSCDNQRMIHCVTIFLWNSRAELDINAGRAHEREVQEQSATNWQSLSLRGNSDYALEVNFIWNYRPDTRFLYWQDLWGKCPA